MPDRKFYNEPESQPLGKIAEIAQARLGPGSDPDFRVRDVAPLDAAGKTDLSFLDNIRYKTQFLKTGAGACIVHESLAAQAPRGLYLLLSDSPYKSYALAAQALYPRPQPAGEISERAVIHPGAKLGSGCTVEAGAVIGEGAEIGLASWIGAGAVIGRFVKIGNHGRVGENASISHAIIGDHVTIYPGARIGQDGFGFAIDPAGHVKVPQLGRVLIGDHVEIGANTAIDRGSGPDTVIGQGTWIDNLVQVGHNVRIGRGCIIVAQVGISGSTVIEDYAVIAGQVGIAGHLHIGRGARIGAQSGVMRDIPAGEEHFGTPALPIRQKMRQIAALNRLIKRQKSS